MRFAFIILVVALALWLIGLLWFIGIIPRHKTEESVVTDAIVVLTGGALRVEYGLELLAHGKAKKLFVSGVGKKVRLEELIEIPSHNTLAKYIPAREQVIVLGYDAGDTRGNAEETARWMRQESFKSLRLVTASYHFPRSMLEFEHAMPDIIIIPEPVFPEQFKRDEWWRFPGTARLILLEYHKYLGRRLQFWFEKMLAPDARDAASHHMPVSTQ